VRECGAHHLLLCRVGNALGAGQPARAKLAAVAAVLSAPVIWVPVALILGLPPSQRLLIRLFTDGADQLLLQRMRGLLYIVVVLELFDGSQTGERAT
jgi:MATE family multidrug resistance protein